MTQIVCYALKWDQILDRFPFHKKLFKRK